MEQADLIWMNGEFVNWEDAKVHVLTHGLHYGTGVFEGIRCYDTEIGPAVFRHQDHVDRLFKSAELYYMPIPFDREQLRAGDAGAHRPQRLSLLLHPPDRLPRLRDDGPVPARRAGRRLDRRLGVGRLPRRGGQAQRRAGQGLVLAADQQRLADPAREGQRPVPQLDPRQDRVPQGRLRGGDPPRRPRLRLRGLGREHLRRPRRRASSRRRRPPAILDGINRKSAIQIAARPRLRGRRAQHRARRALPRRRAVHDRHGGRARRRSARSTTTRSAPASPARSPARSSRPSRTRCTAAIERYREWLDPVPVRDATSRDRSSSTTPPCATGCRVRA